MEIDKKVEELFDYLPHRPPMVWVDRVIEVDTESIQGTCSVALTKDSLFVDEQGRLRGSAAIEFTAQAYGYVRAMYHIIKNIDNTPERTYLTGVRSCRSNLSDVTLDSTDELHIKVKLTRELHPLVFVKGQVFRKGDENPVAEAEVQVYAE